MKGVVDFVRCQRADGSHYGTAGKCQKGREVGYEDALRKMGGTKRGVVKELLGKGESKSLGNGVGVVRGEIKGLEALGKVSGVARPLAAVKGAKGDVVVARKTVKPWENLELPKGALRPYRQHMPMRTWLVPPTARGDVSSVADVDMAVNPTLLNANKLIKSSYDRYNKEFFNNKLPSDLNLYIAPSMHRAYGITQMNKGDKNPFIALSWPLMKGATEEAIHGILLHEMVHVWDYTQGRTGDGHGAKFTTKLDKINAKWKRDSSDIYVDSIVVKDGGMTKSEVKKIAKSRDFSFLKNTAGLRNSAINDHNYRKVENVDWGV